jgi:ABC-2 type transport system permease protein
LGQITAALGKTVKELLRGKIMVFWTIAWPIIWVILSSFTFTGDAPADVIPSIRGAITVPMMVFALMIAGMASLPGNIAEDRKRGLLSKLMSMPVKPWRDLVGRILGLLAFSSLAAVLVVLVGYGVGARFSYTVTGVLQAIGFLLLIMLASAGIGMLIGTFIKNVDGAVMTGVGTSVITAALSGVMMPYSALPAVLKDFAKIYPVSSANSSIIYLLVGENYAGYNPLSIGQTTLTIITSLLLFVAGLIAYSRFCWRKE